jgi:hypothetical protein
MQTNERKKQTIHNFLEALNVHFALPMYKGKYNSRRVFKNELI